MLVAASLMGCMEFLEMASTDVPPPSDGPSSSAVPRRSETTAVTVRVAGPLTIASAKGSHADITSVTVTVARVDSQGTPLAKTLKRSDDDGSWTGTLSGLAVDTPLTFTAQALDSENRDIQRYPHRYAQQRRRADHDPAERGRRCGGNRFPKVTGISISNVSTGVAADVSITVQGSATEQLHYELTGGTLPAARSIPAAARSRCRPAPGLSPAATGLPDVPGWYTVQIALRNAQGNRVEVDFQIRVQTAGLTAKLGPVVRGITGKRTPAGVRWTAAVSADDDGSGLTYAWSFTGTEAFTDSAANPTILTSYTQTTTGTVSVTVTDAVGLTTTASLAVPANLFPDLDLMPAAATLLVNEVDYDQTSSTDAAEFIEILNPGSDPVDLAAYRIELVDGADDDDAPYLTYEPSGELAGGGFLVIADQAVITANSLPETSLVLTGTGIQNGPDGVRIVAKADGRVVDAVHYERVVPGAGEGSAAPQDPEDQSIGRCPNGFDSNDNGLDFKAMTATPGAANTCS